MSTRFYLPGAGSAAVSPAFDSNWEVTAGATRYPLVYRFNRSLATAASSNSITVPITATQDGIACQFISEPIRGQLLQGTFSLIVRVSQNATTVNCTLACSVRLVSNDGNTIRGTLFSVYGTDTAYPLTASPATRIVNAQTITPLTAETGDRIVVEIGYHATAPSTTDTVIHRTINDNATADYALTSGLTTSLNPWCEFSQDIFTTTPNKGIRPHLFSPGLAR